MADPDAANASRRRPPPARVAPEALATARGGALEGLAWLGRPPESKASVEAQMRIEVGDSLPFELYRQRYISAERLGVPGKRAPARV